MAVHVVTIKRAATISYLISILDIRLKTSLMRLVWFVSFSCYGMGVKPLRNLPVGGVLANSYLTFFESSQKKYLFTLLQLVIL